LLTQLLVLGLRIEHVTDPSSKVTCGLERPAGAFLQRGKHLHEPTLNSVQPAGSRLAEVGGEQRYGEADEHGQNRASPANRFLVHEKVSGVSI
jgi:hypothetical protein